MKIREQFRKFRAAYPALIPELNLDTINWNIFAFLFFILIPLFLYLIQLLILTETIPYPVAIKYFVLTFNDPNFANMFLSNYIHSVFDYNHIYQNVLSSITIFLMIYLYFLFVLPYIKFKIPSFQFRFNPRAFVLTLIVIFCYLPFSISGISIYFGKILGKSIAWGYSGLLYTFLGFFFYLIVELLITITLQKASGTIPSPSNFRTGSSPPGAGQEQQGNDYAVLSASLIFACVFVPFLMIAFILSELIQPGTGVFAHLGGFMLGFIIAPVIEMLTLSRLKKQKNAFCVILTLIVVVPAVFWLPFV
ncbi:MAG: hypothetical protein NTV10_06945 [Methanoregula sp.]|nr:hypothetical protein [Methanoregula sp.]